MDVRPLPGAAVWPCSASGPEGVGAQAGVLPPHGAAAHPPPCSREPRRFPPQPSAPPRENVCTLIHTHFTRALLHFTTSLSSQLDTGSPPTAEETKALQSRGDLTERAEPAQEEPGQALGFSSSSRRLCPHRPHRGSIGLLVSPQTEPHLSKVAAEGGSGPATRFSPWQPPGFGEEAPAGTGHGPGPRILQGPA